MVGQMTVEITVALKINVENMRIEVSENVIQYQQIALKCVGSSNYKCFPVKRDLSCFLMTHYINKCIRLKIVSDSVIFIQLTVVCLYVCV